jgi:3-(3-hydroxy-phenyl)propionate hydroxylase
VLRNAVVISGLRVPKLRDYFHEARFKPGPVFAAGVFLGQPRSARSGAQGRLFPQPLVRSSDGRHQRFDEVAGDAFCLVGIECDPVAYLPPNQLAVWDRVGVTTLTLYGFGHRPQGQRLSGVRIGAHIEELEDLHGTALAWTRRHHVRSGDVLVLRPDHVVFAVVPAARVSAATTWLSSELGLSPQRAPQTQH